MKCLLPFILSVLLLFSGCSAVEPESSVLDTTQVSVLAQQQLDEEFADIAGFRLLQKGPEVTGKLLDKMTQEKAS